MAMHQLKIILPAIVWHRPWRWPSILHQHFTWLWILSFPRLPRSHLMASSHRWLWYQLLGYASYLTYLLHVFASWDTNTRIRKRSKFGLKISATATERINHKKKSRQALQKFCIKQILLQISRAQQSRSSASKGVSKADDNILYASVDGYIHT